MEDTESLEDEKILFLCQSFDLFPKKQTSPFLWPGRTQFRGHHPSESLSEHIFLIYVYSYSKKKLRSFLPGLVKLSYFLSLFVFLICGSPQASLWVTPSRVQDSLTGSVYRFCSCFYAWETTYSASGSAACKAKKP